MFVQLESQEEGLPVDVERFRSAAGAPARTHARPIQDKQGIRRQQGSGVGVASNAR